MRQGLAAACFIAALGAAAASRAGVDEAAAFGAREQVAHLRLSPDGARVAYTAPDAQGQGATAFTFGLDGKVAPRPAVHADGAPDRLGNCGWIASDRLVCTVYGVDDKNTHGLLPFTRLVAIDADGRNLRVLSTLPTNYTRGFQLGGGQIIDWLPEENGAALMTRQYLPDDHTGTRLGSAQRGLAVDWIDTRTLRTRTLEPPLENAVAYVSDGRGHVRLMGVKQRNAATGQDSGVVTYWYRTTQSRDWRKLGDFDFRAGEGFWPLAVDPNLDVAYGFRKKDGRRALYTLALDGSMRETLINAHPDVDLDGLVHMGRRARVVGVSYTTDSSHIVYIDPQIEAIVRSLSRALPKQPLVHIVDSSLDESKLLVFVGSDEDPGVFFVFARGSHQLHTFLVTRGELEGVPLAAVKSLTYPAADGTAIPAYLTLPPGKAGAKGLPAIVMPHGGPSSRDRWGFDWLAQFFAVRGYAVLQPNYRGSSGYGDAWLHGNGFKSWRLAMGDVLDGGRWLLAQGIAAPSRLAIVGWSYGGYAALQSAVMEPDLFKAVVAIAPVTDLRALKEEARGFSNFQLVSQFVGEDAAEITAGSPADNARQIKVPVLLFHGTLDRNVSVEESREMAARLAAAGVPHELLIYKGLDHQLEDSQVRADMLRRSDAFLRQNLGL